MRKSQWSLRRWWYQKQFLIMRRLRQFDAWYAALFYDPAALSHYLPRLKELQRLLEEVLLEEVTMTYKQKTRAAVFATKHDMIVRVTIFPQGTGIHKKTSIVFRYNPKYQNYQIWFSACFFGLRLRFIELPLQLTADMETPRKS